MKCAVRSVLVKVRQVLGQHALEMAAVENQYPVEQLAAKGADPSFGDRVRLRCSYRCAQDADGFAGEDGVEAVGELGVAIPEANVKLAAWSPRSISRFSGQACSPGWRVRPGFGGIPESGSPRPAAALAA